MKFTGKTVADAIDAGLNALGITEEQAKVSVISEGVRGLFGRVKEEAVVDVCVKEEDLVVEKTVKEEKIETPTPAKCKSVKTCEKSKTVEFVQKILEHLGIDAKAQLKSEGKETVILLTSETSENVIGYRGEVLDAIQTLAGAKENCGRKDYKKVVVDCQNYREKREETLISLAHKLEAKATDMRREVILEPMNPAERRIIHTALAESTTVTTRSDGKDPNRYVVIVPNDKDEFSKPYNAGRNNDRKKGNNHSKGNRRSNGRNGRERSGNGGNGGVKKSSTITFGTYLGNSLKDNID